MSQENVEIVRACSSGQPGDYDAASSYDPESSIPSSRSVAVTPGP